MAGRRSNEQPLADASTRRVLTTTLKAIWSEQRANAYRKVHRGPINWTSFNFETYPRAVAILLDEVQLFRITQGFIRATLSMEIMCRLPDQPEEIDDGLMDDLYEDVEQVIKKLSVSVDDEGNPVIAFINRETANVIETHDATRGVQGLVVLMEVDF